jgi:hypothetical protein
MSQDSSKPIVATEACRGDIHFMCPQCGMELFNVYARDINDLGNSDTLKDRHPNYCANCGLPLLWKELILPESYKHTCKLLCEPGTDWREAYNAVLNNGLFKVEDEEVKP